jgi:alkyldihydroxyacetonephosphate synthase
LPAVSIRRRKHWGWGFEDQQPTPAQVRASAGELAAHLGIELDRVEDPVPLEALELAAPRIAVPSSLASICSDDTHARASHALGKSY